MIASPTPVPTVTVTPAPLPTVTVTPTPLPTVTVTPTPLPTVTVTPTPLPTVTVTPTPLPTVTVTPTPSPSASPSPSPTRTEFIDPTIYIESAPSYVLVNRMSNFNARGGTNEAPITASTSTPQNCSAVVGGTSKVLLNANFVIWSIIEVRGVGIGSCSVTVFKSGVPLKTVSINILGANDQLTSSINNSGYVGNTYQLAAGLKLASGRVLTINSQTPTLCTINGGVLSLIASGICTVGLSAAGTSVYNAYSGTYQFASNPKGSQVVNVSIPSPLSLGQKTQRFTFTVTAPYSSYGLPPTSYSTNTPSICSVVGTATKIFTLTLIAAGTCSVTFSQDANFEYLPSSPVTVTTVITEP